MTTRERRERKAERLREWAGNAAERSEQRFNTATDATAGIPFGQPILVGHHSERRHRNALDKADNNMRKGVEEADKRDRLSSRAAGIESQLENTIFSDDHDAIEKLEAKIAKLETQREGYKSFNAQRRKGVSLDDIDATDALKEAFLSMVRISFASLEGKGGFPKYVLSNLGATIRTAKKRLEGLKLIASGAKLRAWRTITATWDSECPHCDEAIKTGEQISKVAPRRWVHERCAG